MTKTTSVLALIIAVAAIGLLISTISVSNEANGQSTVTVPSWIQQVAGFWSSGGVSDGEFVNAMTFLVEEGIMDLPNTVSIAEAQTITSSLEEMDQRLEKIESQQSTETTIAPTPAIPEEPLEDTTYPYVFAVCPSDKIRHFDKILFSYPEDVDMKGDSKTVFGGSEYIIILEESDSDIGVPIHIKSKIHSHLTDLGYEFTADEYYMFPSELIEILDIEHTAICANKPGVSGSGDTLGYK